MRLSLLGVIALWLLPAAAPATAEPSFDEVAARLAAPNVLRGDFEQVRELQLISKPLISSGRFLLSDMGLYWQQDEPIASVMIADDERLVQRIGDGSLESIGTAGDSVIQLFSRSFLSIFEGDEELLRENFEIDFRPGDAGGWAIRLVPVSYPMAEAIESITVAGDEYIEELRVLSRTSEQTIIRFTNLQTEPGHLTEHELELYAR